MTGVDSSILVDSLQGYEPIEDRWAAMLVAHHGIWHCPGDTEHSPHGLNRYFREYGVVHFSGEEMSRPHRPDLMATRVPQAYTDSHTGRLLLLPGRQVFPRLTLLCWVLERIRQAAHNRPIKVASVWRPSHYNVAVKGSKRSDHLWACAADIDLPTDEYDYVLKWLRMVDRMLWLSVGYHGILSRKPTTRMHVGILAPSTIDAGRPRWWNYDASRPPPPLPPLRR